MPGIIQTHHLGLIQPVSGTIYRKHCRISMLCSLNHYNLAKVGIYEFVNYIRDRND